MTFCQINLSFDLSFWNKGTSGSGIRTPLVLELGPLRVSGIRVRHALFDGTFRVKNIVLSPFDGTFGAKNIDPSCSTTLSELRILALPYYGSKIFRTGEGSP